MTNEEETILTSMEYQQGLQDGLLMAHQIVCKPLEQDSPLEERQEELKFYIAKVQETKLALLQAFLETSP